MSATPEQIAERGKRTSWKTTSKIAQGTRFSRLVVLSDDGVGCQRQVQCVCDCGVVKGIHVYSLGRGATKSCGCMRIEGHAAAAAKNTKHGGRTGRRSKEYAAWAAMKVRCNNPDYKDYPLYGGRGITVCERWQDSFSAFLADMGPKPFSGASLERIDNDAGYSPDNCRWATVVEQSQNRRTNVYVTHDGERMCLKQACEKAGVKYDVALGRRRRGRDWASGQKLSSPVVNSQAASQ